MLLRQSEEMTVFGELAGRVYEPLLMDGTAYL